jgi:hypothetical protein
MIPGIQKKFSYIVCEDIIDTKVSKIDIIIFSGFLMFFENVSIIIKKLKTNIINDVGKASFDNWKGFNNSSIEPMMKILDNLAVKRLNISNDKEKGVLLLASESKAKSSPDGVLSLAK